MKPFSDACEQNKWPILEVLRVELATRRAVLEIGGGTGQHAVFFAGELAHLIWHASDVGACHAGMGAWMAEADLDNLRGPHLLDVNQAVWPELDIDAVFSANTTHIMDWGGVASMFAGIGRVLPAGGVFCLYGPFNYHGDYTSASNERFDRWLKARDAGSGLRDVDDLNALARAADMTLARDHEMPVNNRTLVWRKG